MHFSFSVLLILLFMAYRGREKNEMCCLFLTLTHFMHALALHCSQKRNFKFKRRNQHFLLPFLYKYFRRQEEKIDGNFVHFDLLQQKTQRILANWQFLVISHRIVQKTPSSSNLSDSIAIAWTKTKWKQIEIRRLIWLCHPKYGYGEREKSCGFHLLLLYNFI